MDYIINPMWFYWINVVSTIKVILILLEIGTIIALSFGVVGYCLTYKDNLSDGEFEASKKLIRISLPMAIVTAILLIFIPGKQTMIEMQIARYATTENAEWTVETIKSAVDYIVESMQKLK